jgi:aryl-alcohol dehydrogenase-like predicted oxidoreductase
MCNHHDETRRSIMKGAAILGAATLARGMSLASQQSSQPSEANQPVSSSEQVPHRPLGNTGITVSAIALGGYHLGSTKNQQEANEIVAKAMDAGVIFFDNAWDYHQGQSEAVLGNALKGKRDRAVIMTKVCTHGRGKDVAMQQLEQSLRRLQTDHLDLWQIHEVIYENDPELIFAPDGAAEALLLAKQQGKVRAIGFTGHKDPSIHLRMLAYDFPFDTVQMPLNCLDASFRSFEQRVLPEAQKRGVAVLGMKSMGGSGEIITHGVVTPEEALKYAMSLPVASTISGVDSMDVLEQNLAIARGFQQLSSREMDSIRNQAKGYAADGRFELFKTTKKYDGNVGRQQHHFPSADELPA